MVWPQPLESFPAYAPLRTDLIPTVRGKAGAAAKNDPAFAAIALAATQIDGSLQTLRKREVQVPPHGITVLDQLRFALLEARDFCDQYGTPPAAVFIEPYVAQSRRVLGKLQALEGFLAALAANEGLPQLPKHPSLAAAVAAATGGAPPRRSRGVAPLLSDDARSAERRVLLRAAAGEWAEVEMTLRAAPEQANERGPRYHLLHMAVLWQSSFAVALLLSHGAEVDTPVGEGTDLVPGGSTPLHLACALGSPPMVRLLLAWGADPNVRNSKGLLPSEVPTNHTCLQLLAGAADLRQKTLMLCSAAHKGNGKLLQEMINGDYLPLDVKYSPDSRYFLLHHLAEHNDWEAFDLAVLAGASPLLKTKDGRLPSGVAKANAPRLVARAEAAEAEEARLVAALLSDPSKPDPTSARSASNPANALQTASLAGRGAACLAGASQAVKRGVERVRALSHRRSGAEHARPPAATIRCPN